ncbi:hypothetical protein Godav_019613 [Gossypium davidsonii]|uniref:DUF4283 domain-containing protein n=1 Tax=Gossypium davidsonii TaxID=34287 RepID=A0A7J8R1P3_GOSDV|nr:hypothetical protein [Gossypium davidsonii]
MIVTLEGYVITEKVDRVPSTSFFERALWKPTQTVQLMDLANDYYLKKFKSKDDYSQVLSEGPRIIFSHCLIVQPWIEDFLTLQHHPNQVVVWIRLPDPSGAWYKRSLLHAIAKLVGKVVKIDSNTSSGVKGWFARMAISINLRRSLVSKI